MYIYIYIYVCTSNQVLFNSSYLTHTLTVIVLLLFCYYVIYNICLRYLFLNQAIGSIPIGIKLKFRKEAFSFPMFSHVFPSHWGNHWVRPLGVGIIIIIIIIVSISIIVIHNRITSWFYMHERGPVQLGLQHSGHDMLRHPLPRLKHSDTRMQRRVKQTDRTFLPTRDYTSWLARKLSQLVVTGIRPGREIQLAWGV